MASTRKEHAAGLRRRQQIVDYIGAYIDAHGYSPTYTEISDHLSIALSTLAYHLRRLREDGIVAYEDDAKRTLRVLR